MDVISILQKQRQDVTGFDVHVGGTRAADHPRRYTDIAIEFVVRGRNVSPASLARAVELSETKYCSVTASLNPDIRWTTTQRIIEEE
jgi:putative redox protein